MSTLVTIKKKTVNYGLKAGLGGVIFYMGKATRHARVEPLLPKNKDWLNKMYDHRQAPLLLDPQAALSAVTAGNKKAIYASAGTLFRGAVFGRDSLEVAEDLLEENPELAKNVLTTLASLQGVKFDRKSEEEPGKIAHEHREPSNNKASQIIFDELIKRWGSQNGKLTYYGSTDATPLFIRVLCSYVRRYGNEILMANVTHQNGASVTMREALDAAISWLITKLEASSSGLLEYKALNPEGIENQVWKDSREFYVHEDGTLANHKQPIASIETQGLAYDALLQASEVQSEQSKQLKAMATKLRDRTIELLWMPERRYFALGVDHNETGKLRQIKTKAANPAALLDSSFFDELPEAKRKAYIGGIVINIMGSDFLTDAGIRSRALSEADVVPFWDYHGSHTSWPKETNDIARGLKRQGFPQLALQLENRLLNAVTRANSYPEFVYVDDNGRMLTDIPHVQSHESIVLVEGTNKPEELQAWTISAVLRILENRYSKRTNQKPHQAYWQFQLEWKVLDKMPIIGHIHRPEDLHRLYPHRPYKLMPNKRAEEATFYSPQIRQAITT